MSYKVMIVADGMSIEVGVDCAGKSVILSPGDGENYSMSVGTTQILVATLIAAIDEIEEDDK